MAEEAGGDAGFGIQAGGGQDVGVASFIGAFFEVTDFDPAFGDQGFEAVVYFSQADAESSGESPLWEVGIGLKTFEEIIGGSVVEFEVGHGVWELDFMGFGLCVQTLNVSLYTYLFKNARVIFSGLGGETRPPLLVVGSSR